MEGVEEAFYEVVGEWKIDSVKGKKSDKRGRDEEKEISREDVKRVIDKLKDDKAAEIYGICGLPTDCRAKSATEHQ